MAATHPSSHEDYVGIGSREHDLAGDSITNLRTSPDETAREGTFSALAKLFALFVNVSSN